MARHNFNGRVDSRLLSRTELRSAKLLVATASRKALWVCSGFWHCQIWDKEMAHFTSPKIHEQTRMESIFGPDDADADGTTIRRGIRQFESDGAQLLELLPETPYFNARLIRARQNIVQGNPATLGH